MKKRALKKSVVITKKKTDMPVSELARMVARGFTDIEHRLGDKIDSLGDRMDSVEGHLDSVEGRLTILNEKVDRLQDSVNDLSYETKKKTHARIENLELKVFGAVQEA